MMKKWRQNLKTAHLLPPTYRQLITIVYICRAMETLRKMIYVPGELFSVNPFLAEHVPNLFARNERVICEFDTAFGPMLQIFGRCNGYRKYEYGLGWRN